MFKSLQFHSIRKKLFASMLLTTLTALLILGGALALHDLHDYHERRIEDLGAQSRLIGLTVIPALQFDDLVVAVFELDYPSVSTKFDLRAALSQSWDIVFSDYTMPAFNGQEALAIVRQLDPDVPFFFVSGTMDEDHPAPWVTEIPSLSCHPQWHLFIGR